MDGETKRKRPLQLDWGQLLPSKDNDEPPPDVIVVATSRHQREEEEEEQKQSSSSSMTTETSVDGQREELERMSDKQLEEAIRRQTDTLHRFRSTLPDKGEKLRVCIKRLEDEQERRKLRRHEQEEYVCKKPTQFNSSYFNGGSVSFKQQEAPSSEVQTQSLFTSKFSKRMEEDQTDCRTDNAFDKELSYFARCDRRKMKLNGQSSPKGRQKSKQLPFQCHRSLSLDKDQRVLSNGDQKVRASSTCSLREYGESLSGCLAKKRNASQIPSSKDARLRKGQTYVLVDEEEPQVLETTHEAEKLVESLKDSTIYYPSRDDPESVEIRHSDMECLAPEAFLTSTIMNFYIRYLQQLASATDRERRDYHFFNTYFYKKLKEAVSYKGSDKETVFMKFRRWWKGVSIFQKAYVFIPIHEFLHWSLVIICIPDKEDESGPIILHLDSLGYHNSTIICDNIRSYIREEWNHLNQEVTAPDVPIAEKIWKHLPRRIEVKSIGVPQQENDYDCGLFVLYFMKRFIEEVPDRLKKKDLAMFGNRWFEPEEASDLRGKIWNILMGEFINAK